MPAADLIIAGNVLPVGSPPVRDAVVNRRAAELASKFPLYAPRADLARIAPISDEGWEDWPPDESDGQACVASRPAMAGPPRVR
jgi:hypothetical protein